MFSDFIVSVLVANRTEGCQERWADGSRIQGDMTLYAAYAESDKLEETDGNVFVTKLDQNTDFTIGIQAAESMSAAQVREGILFEAVSEGTHSQTELLVEGSNGSFQVSGSGGFQEGSTYQLTLEDENLSFAGEPENAYIYSFTIKKDDVQNLNLDEDLIYLPADSITEMKKDGEQVPELSVPLAEADINTGTAAVQYSSGSFTDEESELSIGDTVAIYEGQRPDLREINSDSTRERWHTLPLQRKIRIPITLRLQK